MNIQTVNDVQENDYVILYLPVPVPRKAIPSFVSSLMPMLSQPPVLPVQQVCQAEPHALPSSPTHSVTPDQKPRKGMASPKQKQFIFEIVNRINMAKDEMQRELGVKDIEETTNAQANAFISKFKDAKPVF